MTDETTRPTDDDLLMAFYGDDFTGSTDALEGLADNGVPRSCSSTTHRRPTTRSGSMTWTRSVSPVRAGR